MNQKGLAPTNLLLVAGVLLLVAGSYYLGTQAQNKASTPPTYTQEKTVSDETALTATVRKYFEGPVFNSYYATAEINIKSNDGQYAEGNVIPQSGEGPGGMDWFAAKIDGKWTVVSASREPVQCSSIAQYNLPEGFVPCF